MGEGVPTEGNGSIDRQVQDSWGGDRQNFRSESWAGAGTYYQAQ